jgi:dipeptidyl aminopeptidase/acylaminoacyl peptidase
VAEPSASGKSLLDIATAVADGATVDWTTLASDATEPRDRTALEHLKLIEQIANSHGSTILVAADQPPALSDLPADWGPLRVLEQVGRGSFGDVYRAVDGRLDREVALKILRRAGGPEGGAASVIDEARLMARIRHPNVITIYGADRVNGRVGLWMEFVHGQTLESDLRSRGPFSTNDITQVGIAVAGALGAVHTAGLLHRDVKAQNVMRDREGRTLLTDFGTGRELTDAVVAQGELARTPVYLAPEVIDGAPATVTSDLYSLGVLLFHLATGTFPVRGASVRALREAHRSGLRTAVRDVRPDLPVRLALVIDRAIAVDPAQRYQSSAELAAALSKLSRRSPFLPVLGFAALLSLVVALSWWQLGVGRPPTPDDGPRRLLTTEAFVVHDISPDGQWAAGIERRDAAASLVLRNLASGARVVLVDGTPESSGLTPIFSRDGRRIAFRRVLGRPGPQWSASSIAIMDVVRGATVHSLSPLKSRNLRPVGWRRDGSALLVAERQPGSRPSDSESLAWISTGGKGPMRAITELPSWRAMNEIELSPDDRWIVFAANVRQDSADRRLFLIDAETGRECDALRFAGVSSDPIWAPDGQRVFFVSNRSGARALWSVRVSDTGTFGEAALVASGFSGQPVGISALGRLFFSQATGGEPVEFLIARGPDGPRVVETFIGEKGQFSTTGARVAFMRRRSLAEIDLIIRSVSDGEELALPRVAIGLGPPRWVGGDRYLLAPIQRGGFIRVDTHQTGVSAFAPGWSRSNPELALRNAGAAVSPGGTALYLPAIRHVDGQAGVATVDAETGRVSVFTPLPIAPSRDAQGEDFALAVSPDESSFAVVSWADHAKRLARLSLVTANGVLERELYQPFASEFLATVVDWDTDGRSLLLVETQAAGAAKVLRIPRDGGPVQPTGIDTRMLSQAFPGGRLMSRLGMTFDVSPDGVHLLLAMSTLSAGEIWALDGVLAPAPATRGPSPR